MLTHAFGLLGPAAAGLGGLPFGLSAPLPGMLGLAAAALFAALLGGLSAGPAPDAARPADRLTRRAAALCAACFTAMGGLAGLVAWEVWATQGPTRALGLVAVALGFLTAALGCGGRALRRR